MCVCGKQLDIGKNGETRQPGELFTRLVVPGVAAQVDTRHENARNNARSAAMRGTPAFTTPHGLVDGGGPVSRREPPGFMRVFDYCLTCRSVEVFLLFSWGMVVIGRR